MPRWVKVFVIVVIALVLMFFIVVVTGFGGPHGPGRHLQSDHPAGQTSSQTTDDPSPLSVGAPSATSRWRSFLRRS